MLHLSVGPAIGAPQPNTDPAARLKAWLTAMPTIPTAASASTVSLRAREVLPSFSPRSFFGLDDTRFDILTRAWLTSQGTATLADGIARTYYRPTAYAMTGNDPLFCVRFRTDAAVIGIVHWSTPANFQLVVDGQLLVATGYSAATGGGERRVLEVDFGSAATRDVTLITNSQRLAGVFLPASASLLTPKARPAVIAVMADSYGQSDGERFKYGLAVGIASRLGTPTVFNDAVGGTGFRQTNGGLTPSANSFADRLGFPAPNQTTPSGLGASLALTIGGINDQTNLTVGQIGTYLAAVRLKHPAAVHAIIGPQCPRGDHAADSEQKYAGLAQKIRDALAATSGPWIYVDPLTNTWRNSRGATGGATDGPWITGYGRQIAFTAPPTAATSATLTSAWTGASGTWSIDFSDGSKRSVALTAGSTVVTWAGAVTATATAAVYQVDGNAKSYVTDWTHLNAAGIEYWSAKAASAIRAAAAAF